ncbi:hypothetical protein C8R43DRAFT_1162878 [Mycena crocata]|nr:hypothetical protein C8R43DRAFT_1162878 [Mycena crocata]
MAPSTPRPPTPRRLKTLQLRESLDRQIIRQTQEFSPPMPADPAGSSSCRLKKMMCYGKGDVFDNIGRWCALCLNRAHSDRKCAKLCMLTPRLHAYDLDILHHLWVQYDQTGKKWGKQDVPEYLLAPIPPPQPLIISAASRTAPQKRKRSPSPAPIPIPALIPAPIPAFPAHVPVRFIDLEVIDLTVASHKKRKIVVDLTK